MRNPFRTSCLAAALSMVLLAPGVLWADVTWQWSFGTEAGTFVTTGEFADTASSNTFTITDFTVTASSEPTNVGTVYIVTQPAQGFQWDGTQPTEFFRADGVFTNGSNFFHPVSTLWYGFNPAQSCVHDELEDDPLFCDDLSLVPLSEVTALTPLLLGLLATLTIAAAGRRLTLARLSSAD